MADRLLMRYLHRACPVTFNFISRIINYIFKPAKFCKLT